MGRERYRWEDSGEAAREDWLIEKPALLGTPLAEAVMEIGEHSSGSGNSTLSLFKASVGLCATYRQTGCVLAWWLIAGLNHEELGGITANWLQRFLKISAKDTPFKGRSREAIFPVRTGELSDLVGVFAEASVEDITTEAMVNMWWHKAWVYVCACTLNRLAGCDVRPKPGRWTIAEHRMFTSVGKAVERRCSSSEVPAPLSESAWQKDMSSRQVGYSGEEVATCHELTWDQILPALPPESHGGCIDTLKWVGHRTREYLLSPDWLLKPQEEVELPRMPGRVHIKKEDRMPIAHELVRRKICSWIPLRKVHHVNSTPVLNGLFGVAKPVSLEDGRPILRLIMNLTGPNSTQLQLEGGCNSLPAITFWQSIIIDEAEQVKFFQSDMSSAFYLFKIPAVWYGHLAFNILAPGFDVGADTEELHALCCAVIPMGWLNSVGVMQELSENLLIHQGMPTELQVARDRPLPVWMNSILGTAANEERSWWHVYLDNYAGGERLIPEHHSVKGQQCHEHAEKAWATAGVISSEKKRVSASKCVTELGAEINGEDKTLGLPLPKLLKLIQSTMWLLSQRFLNRKFAQVIAGRWVFALQFRRAGMGFLQKIWRFTSGSEPITDKLRNEVRAELFSLVCISPLFHCFLGAEVSRFVVCTDASETGGAIELAEELTSQGLDFLQSSQILEHSRETNHPILLISLFNGIGGCFRCYDVAGISPMHRVAVELDEGGNRITQRRWPGTVIVKDVRSVDRKMIQSWARKFLRVKEIHLWAGWPCVDLSRVKHNRQNLQGSQSSLIFEVLRIKALLEEEFGWNVEIKFVFENVASMDRSAAEEISHLVGAIPYAVDCAQAVPMRRPRYAWTSETVEALMPDVSVHPQAYWKDVVARAEYPATSQWLTPGYQWHGEHQGAIFPTCLKSIPRRAPPEKPAGLGKCSEATKSRWREDSFRYPPYQYDEKFLITTENTWRLLNAEDKELLLGYGFQHTILGWSTSRIKQDPVGFSDTRHRFLGDSFSIYSFVIFAVACCRKFLPHLTYEFLTQRMGVAPGFRAHLRQTCPLVRSLAYGSKNIQASLFGLGMEFLNRMLLRKTNHTGSDIRVVSGEVLNSKTYPRQSVSSKWWQWKSAFRKRWRFKGHINVLELETVLLGIKFQILRLKAVDQRIFQLTDSYVCQSVVSKGRTSSLQLTRVMNHISAHLLGFGLHMIMGHVESGDNPADDGSRK